MTLLTRASLVAAAQVDPWAMLAQLEAGDPAQIEELASAFYRASGHTRAALSADAQAKRYVRAGYTVNGTSPLDYSADARRTAASLHDAADALPKIAKVLTAVADDLQTSTGTVTTEVHALDATLDRIEGAWTTFMQGVGHHLPSDDQEAARNGYVAQAVAAVASAGASANRVVTSYEHTLARASKSMADLGYVTPDSLREAGEVETAPLPVGSSPTKVADWWSRLTPAQREYLIDHRYQTLGQLKGLPAPVLDTANRHRIHDDRSSLDQRLAALDNHNDPTGVVRAGVRRLIANDDGILRTLHAKPAGVPAPIYVLAFDPDGKQGQTGVAISYGNPDTADNTAVVVPGTGNNASNLSSVAGNASNLYRTMSGNRAVVAWLNGPEPQDLPHAALDSYANDSAPHLVGDIAGLRASHDAAIGSGGHLTMIGHSYGSYIAGKAMTQGAKVDDVVFVGSPGVGVDHAKDLGIDPHHVWDGEAGDDPILLTEKRFTPDPLTGNNPEDGDFGALHFDVSGSHGHSEYYKAGSSSLRNMAHIADGDYPAVHTVHAPDYRGLRELPGDWVASAVNPFATDYDTVKDLVTGHPLEAGSAYYHGAVNEGKDVLHLGEDGVHAAGTGLKKVWDAL
ncbi:alpha/beta hydrolase [uncultured Jatrophihabitans sp.]|uniref:putative alpha/beta hydrolase n=1 Tax=uncultured Jatrophihabitans sp. TaxID=1610747 RepID=UPI0035CABB10